MSSLSKPCCADCPTHIGNSLMVLSEDQQRAGPADIYPAHAKDIGASPSKEHPIHYTVVDYILAEPEGDALTIALRKEEVEHVLFHWVSERPFEYFPPGSHQQLKFPLPKVTALYPPKFGNQTKYHWRITFELTHPLLVIPFAKSRQYGLQAPNLKFSRSIEGHQFPNEYRLCNLMMGEVESQIGLGNIAWRMNSLSDKFKFPFEVISVKVEVGNILCKNCDIRGKPSNGPVADYGFGHFVDNTYDLLKKVRQFPHKYFVPKPARYDVLFSLFPQGVTVNPHTQMPSPSDESYPRTPTPPSSPQLIIDDESYAMSRKDEETECALTEIRSEPLNLIGRYQTQAMTDAVAKWKVSARDEAADNVFRAAFKKAYIDWQSNGKVVAKFKPNWRWGSEKVHKADGSTELHFRFQPTPRETEQMELAQQGAKRLKNANDRWRFVKRIAEEDPIEITDDEPELKRKQKLPDLVSDNESEGEDPPTLIIPCRPKETSAAPIYALATVWNGNDAQ